MKKIILPLCALLFFCRPIFAQERPLKPVSLVEDVRLLREARNAYARYDYGGALRRAEEAKNARTELIRWETYTLQNSLRPAQVRRVGDAIPDVLAVLAEREDRDAIDIIESYVKKIGADFFNNSAAQLSAYVGSRVAFPEADWLIGRVYRLEGEYALSRRYLSSAWENRALLDVYDESKEILYDLAEVAQIEGDADAYEKNLLLVLGAGSAFNDSNQHLEDTLMLALRAGDAGAAERFFTLFRSGDYAALSAYLKLADFYAAAGENEKALLASALGSLTGFTKMYNALRAREPRFEYAGLADLLSRAASYADISDWAAAEGLWQGFSAFAQNLEEDGNVLFAANLRAALAGVASTN